MTTIAKIALPILVSVVLFACNNDEKSKQTPDNSKTKPADSPKVTQPTTTGALKPPIINIIDTLSVPKTVLYMKDSAASFDRIGLKLGMIYGEKLGKCLADNKLTMTGAPMAWYKSQKPPFFFEAGVPVNKKPAKLPVGVYVKEIPAGHVVVARFFGPYNQLGTAYETMKERLKASKTVTVAPPYEIYVGDPGVQKDPYKVQTDVVFPVKAPAQN